MFDCLAFGFWLTFAVRIFNYVDGMAKAIHSKVRDGVRVHLFWQILKKLFMLFFLGGLIRDSRNSKK